MSNTIKSILAFGLVGFIAACGQQQQQEEFVVVDPAPISIEPEYTGKYK
jgi:outer membrane lipopolysaccharide assembly protein LptE/RlpB